MQLIQLMEENDDLNAMLGELRFELEALKDRQMERMECSISSPVRMSLGPVLERLDVDQDSQGGNISSNISYDLETILHNNRWVRVYFSRVASWLTLFAEDLCSHYGAISLSAPGFRLQKSWHMQSAPYLTCHDE